MLLSVSQNIIFTVATETSTNELLLVFLIKNYRYTGSNKQLLNRLPARNDILIPLSSRYHLPSLKYHPAHYHSATISKLERSARRHHLLKLLKLAFNYILHSISESRICSGSLEAIWCSYFSITRHQY